MTLLTDAQIQTACASATTQQISPGDWWVTVPAPVGMKIGAGASSAANAIASVQASLLANPSVDQTAFNNQQAAIADLATIQTNLSSQLTTIETWITNNPSGAVLTAAQTLTVARMLAGLTRIAIAALSSVGGS
jgi:hypothetical protein